MEPVCGPQDYITERIKKIGGFTSFNMFLMKELDIMYKLIVDIKTSLQVGHSSALIITLWPSNSLPDGNLVWKAQVLHFVKGVGTCTRII